MKKTANLLVTAYLLLLFVAYPFYMKEGYVEIGRAKYSFWIRISLSTAAVLLLFFVIRLIRELKEKSLQLQATDISILVFAGTLLLTLVLAVDRKEALFGTEGWNMGFALYGVLCLLYLMIRLLWKPDKWIIYLALLASGGIYLLGILDRFSLYLIPLEIRNPGFLSTLGNINWFTGYLVIFTAVSASLFLLSEEKGMMVFSAVITLLGFAAGFSQGSSSVFLFFAGLFLALFWLASYGPGRVLRLMILWTMWCGSAQLIRLMRILVPDGYQYDTENLCGYFTGGNLSVYLLVTGELFLGAFWILLKYKEQTGKWIRRGLGILGGLLVAFVAAMVLYSYFCVSNGMELSELYDRLPWGDDTWGNGRGMTYRAAMMILAQMTPLQRLLGVGQDCFSAYAYSIPQVADELWQYFGNERLTNAHSEILTMLVNHGIVGTVSYLSIFITYLYKTGKQSKNPYSISIAVAVICYLVHNMVSFANVLNLPFLIILLAMGVKWCNIMMPKKNKRLRSRHLFFRHH